MICPVCETGGQTSDHCAQCGSDIEIHRVIRRLIPLQEPVERGAVQGDLIQGKSVHGETMPTPVLDKDMSSFSIRGERTPGSGFKWIYLVLSGALNFLLLGSLVGVLFYLGNSGSEARSSTMASKAEISPTMPGLYFEDIRTLTGILKQTLDIVDDQRREITELRAKLHSTNVNWEQEIGQSARQESLKKGTSGKQE